MERQKPISTTRNYLENVQAMNFDGMKNLLQSNDMSALDNADITSEAYTNFFKAINQKMTFEIRKTKFNIQNGTATVTAHIKYIDGSDIYKEAVTEFFQQIALPHSQVRQQQQKKPRRSLPLFLKKSRVP